MLKMDFFFVSCAWLFISWNFPTAKVEAKNVAGNVPAWNYDTGSAWVVAKSYNMISTPQWTIILW